MALKNKYQILNYYQMHSYYLNDHNVSQIRVWLHKLRMPEKTFESLPCFDHNSRCAWPTEILIPILCFLRQFAAVCIFLKIDNNFKIVFKTCLILLRGAVPP